MDLQAFLSQSGVVLIGSTFTAVVVLATLALTARSEDP